MLRNMKCELKGQKGRQVPISGALIFRSPYLSAQTAFYSLNPDRNIPGPLAINLLT
jgi:hypothetical protein